MHEKRTEEVTFIDHRGRKRTVTKAYYVPTEAKEQKTQDAYLGLLKDTPLLNPTPPWMGRTHAVIYTNLSKARSLIRTKLGDSNHPYLIVTGQEVMNRWKPMNEPFAYDEEAHLFILFGYSEAKNRHLPLLIRQVYGTRKLRQLPTWLITPVPLEHMITYWGPSIASLRETILETDKSDFVNPVPATPEPTPYQPTTQAQTVEVLISGNPTQPTLLPPTPILVGTMDDPPDGSIQEVDEGGEEDESNPFLDSKQDREQRRRAKKYKKKGPRS